MGMGAIQTNSNDEKNGIFSVNKNWAFQRLRYEQKKFIIKQWPS